MGRKPRNAPGVNKGHLYGMIQNIGAATRTKDTNEVQFKRVEENVWLKLTKIPLGDVFKWI